MPVYKFDICDIEIDAEDGYEAYTVVEEMLDLADSGSICPHSTNPPDEPDEDN